MQRTASLGKSLKIFMSFMELMSVTGVYRRSVWLCGPAFIVIKMTFRLPEEYAQPAEEGGRPSVHPVIHLSTTTPGGE